MVPLALPQRSLPRSVRLDASSPWNVTALLAAALESTTLYTRLKTTDRANASSLGNIADLLNVFGKQVIANLQMSIVSAPAPSESDGANGANGTRTRNGDAAGGALPSFSDTGPNAYEAYGAYHRDEDDVSEDGPREQKAASLDIDFSSPEDADLGSGSDGRRRRRKPHVFSQFLTYRGPENPGLAGENGQDDSRARGGYLQRRPKVHS